MLPKNVKINEVGPRDGLQNEKTNISVREKVKCIHLLNLCNYRYIEVGSFVSPKWVPQMKNSDIVYKEIFKNKKTIYPLLVPNTIGLQKALEGNVQTICVFATASEEFSKKNTNASIEQTKKNITEILRIAKKSNLKIRAYMSCVLGCPYEGKVSYKKTANLANFLINEGCYEVSLGDTVGYGTPLETQKLIYEVSKNINYSKIAMHLHDTYGQALANIYASMQMGVASFDTSVGGLGGCPYAKGASGNVATEDVIYMLNGMNIKSGINLKKVLTASKFIYKILNRNIVNKTASAMISK